MRHTQLTFGGRLRAAFIGGGASLVLMAMTLAGTALAADQPTTQTSDPHSHQALGPHTHQLHGLVNGTPSATGFTLTVERFGESFDVTVSFAGVTPTGRGHAQGKARSFEVARATDLKDKDRVVVLGSTSADGKSFVARRVHVLPAKDAAAHPTHLVGTIFQVASSNGVTTLTVTLADKSTKTVTLSARIRPEGKAVADLTVGTKVTVVSKNGTATGVVVLPT